MLDFVELYEYMQDFAISYVVTFVNLGKIIANIFIIFTNIYYSTKLHTYAYMHMLYIHISIYSLPHLSAIEEQPLTATANICEVDRSLHYITEHKLQ